MTVVPTSARNVGRQMDVRDGAISCLHARPRPNCRYADGIVSSCGSSWVREKYETEREGKASVGRRVQSPQPGSPRYFFAWGGRLDS